MVEVAWKYITSPTQTEGDDGLGFWHGETIHIHDCYIDLQGNPISELDEAIGITCGAGGIVERCVIRGAAKQILCGCGDADKVGLERGKRVLFRDCIIEQGGRRFPEVQDGMIVELENCLIQDWGMKSRFKDRSFAAWAHKEGVIHARHCVFRQQSVKRGVFYWAMDLAAHVWQALLDDGPVVLFQRKTWLPGTLRALTSDNTGHVSADECWASHKAMLIENHFGEMSDYAAYTLIERLEKMRAELKQRLGIV